MSNPFTLSFGKQPLTYISRLEQTNEVVENFTGEPANCMMYMITGVRGVGKTCSCQDFQTLLKNRDKENSNELTDRYDKKTNHNILCDAFYRGYCNAGVFGFYGKYQSEIH